MLSIASHHHRHVSQSFFSVHNSRLIARNIPALPEQRLANFNHGTRVSVRALFASLPVRVKYHAKIFADRATVDREWRNLIDEVVALLLAWPSSVSVYINELGSRRELRLHPGSDTDPGPRTSRLFTQASLADSADGPSWLPVSASSLHFRVEGCISTRPAVKRRSQMMSLGIWPILNSGSASVLFDEINTIFSCSDFAISPDENSQERKSKRGLKSKPRKGIDRWPMFYLRILPHNSTPLVVNHVLDAGSREFSCILDILRAVCTSFLKKLSLRPRSTGPARVPAARVLREAKKNATSRPSLCLATQPLTSRHALPRSLPGRTRRESPFDDWHQLKIGFPSLPPPGKQVGHGAWRQGGRPAEPVNRFVGEDGELLGKPFEEDQCADYSGRPNGSVSVVPAKRPAVHLDGEPAEAPGEWLRKILSSWENPVFETAEAPIPQICGHAGDLGRGAPHRPRPSPWTVNFEAASLAMVGRLSKAALARAVVIAQLDCKFILVKMPLQSPADGAAASSALVVVDQHAADERCRLEDLMAAYFTRDPASDCLRPVVEPLEHPLVFELSGCEGELLGRYRPQLASWGILYHLEADGPPTSRPAAAGSDPGCRATVTSLPPSILERCRAEPRLLIDLVRTHLWALDEARLSNAFPPSSSADETSWLPRFHGCPTGILHLLHSRSCRSKSPDGEGTSSSAPPPSCRLLPRPVVYRSR